MDPTTHALLALRAVDDGDTATAEAHLATAQRQARSGARRDRQIVEIAALVVAGQRTRASGLAVVHRAEFPADGDLVARIAERGGT